MKVGIANLQMLLGFSLHLANVVDEVTNHPTTIMEKLAGAMKLIPDASLLATVQFSALSDEVSDLDDAEKGQLKQFLKDQFAIADHKLESAIEDGIGLLLDLEGLIKKGAAIAQAVKG